MYFDDLENLNDILDKIEPEPEKNILDEENKLELIESALHIMENYINDNPTAISEPDFDDVFTEYVKEVIFNQLDFLFNDDTSNEKIEEELESIIDESMDLFYDFFMPERSFSSTFLFRFLSEGEKKQITKKLDYLKQMPQPAQRTPEWYTFRHNLITASNAYKAFENDSVKNQLIYEKCQPLSISDNKIFVNTNTPFHWGQKYEPLSVMIYEEKYNVKVGDFGCIQHEKYKFLGASPDGINVDHNSKTYGRMLEIKNIVNRDIDGVPKKEYWIQMQLQMETCNFDECDFLETRFIEYQDTEESSASEKFEKESIFSRTQENERKGVILYFAKADGNPFYKYMPLCISSKEDFEKWEEEMMDLYQSAEHKMTWIKNLYWRLEEFSCILVLRNTRWFQDNITSLEKIWIMILKERQTGFEHRAPTKRVKKINTSPASACNEGGCLISMNKESGKISLNAETTNKIIHVNDNVTQQPKIDVFFKIRTESFDEAKQKLPDLPVLTYLPHLSNN